MRLPREAYPFFAAIATYLPDLRPAHQRGLAWWVLGAVLAKSACQSAVLRELGALPGAPSTHALRQRLREWGYAGAAKAAPCQTELAVTACFAPLLRWVLAWWHGTALALAVDVTMQRDRFAVIVVAVLYRGCAIPVAWHVLPANQGGAWMTPLVALLAHLAPAVPATHTVLVLADRGLWSPRLWQAIRRHGWHPLLRVQTHTSFRPQGAPRQRAAALVPGPGHAWVGAGMAFKHRPTRLPATLVVVWEPEAAEPWVVLTDLDPDAIGVGWYGLRMWAELGFRVLKRLGWGWEQTRRTDPARIGRHWLVLAVATLWVLATGTRVEEAELRGVAPANLRVARPPAPRQRPRRASVFALGLQVLHRSLMRGYRLWRQIWLWPEPWPAPRSTLALTIVPAPLPR